MKNNVTKANIDGERLSLALDDLQDAREELMDMDRAFEVRDQKRHWKNFLVSLNKVVDNIKKACNNTGSIYKSFDRHIKNDSLLVFLHQCRNAYDHGVDRPAESVAFLRFPGIPDRDFAIRLGKTPDGSSPSIIQSAWVKRELAENGQIVEATGSEVYDAKNGIQSEFFSKEVVVLSSVSNRNKIYQAPTHHSSQPIKEITPIMFGRLAIKFYEGQLKKIEISTDAGSNPLPSL